MNPSRRRTLLRRLASILDEMGITSHLDEGLCVFAFTYLGNTHAVKVFGNHFEFNHTGEMPSRPATALGIADGPGNRKEAKLPIKDLTPANVLALLEECIE